MTGVPIKEVDIDKIARRLAYLWNLRDKVDADQVNEETGMSQGEEKLMADISGIFANKFSKYAKASQMLQGQKTRSNTASR